jgi:hypothetical protein
LNKNGLVMPTIDDIVHPQRQPQPRALPSELRQCDDGLTINGDLMWMHRDAPALAQCIVMTRHRGQQGHRGRQAMMVLLGRVFYIIGQRKNVAMFLTRCLQFHNLKEREVIPRLEEETFRA